MARRLLHDRPEIAAHDVVTRAMHQAGTDEFAGTSWIEALEVLTRSLDRESGIGPAARRRVRNELVGRLAGRAGLAPGDDSPSTVLAVGLGRSDLDAFDVAMGNPAGRGADLVGAAFASLEDEVRWQLPSFAEWLAESDLSATLADVAELHRRQPPAAPIAVVGSFQLLERLPDARLAFAGAPVVEIVRELDVAVGEVAASSIVRRRAEADDVDDGKVHRYWAWRLGLLAERRAEAGPADLTIDADRLHADPVGVAADVRALLQA